ncbi:MAG: hypothetical protein Q7R79_00305 [bacterium]|nr:hypothetical protein [bacterium]
MDEQMSKDKKIDVLISALEERYKATHVIRHRVQGVCLWALGILFAAAGWLIQADISFEFETTVIIIIFMVVAHHLLQLYFLDLEKGFKGQQGAMTRVEKALNLYTPGYYTEDNSSLYDPKWEKAGSAEGDGKYFSRSYALLQLGGAALIIALLLKTCF